MKRLLAVMTALCILLGATPCLAQGVDVSGYIDKVAQYYKDNMSDLTKADWQDIVALYGAGVNLKDGGFILPQWDGGPCSQTDLFEQVHYIFIGGALGFDVNNFGGQSILKSAADLQDKTSGSIGKLTNTHLWGMIALESFKYAYDGQKALAKLLSMQTPDGGFPLAALSTPPDTLKNYAGDTDITAMALMALSFYKGNGADDAIAKAVGFLKSKQAPTGAFKNSSGLENANTTAVAISGLIEAGEDISSSNWQTANGKTPLDGLLQFMQPSGAFRFSLDSTKDNMMATRQALIALGDIQAGRSAYRRIGEGWLAVQPTSADQATASPGGETTSPSPDEAPETTPQTPSESPDGQTPAPSETPALTPTPSPAPVNGGGSSSGTSSRAYITVKGDSTRGIMYPRRSVAIGSGDTPYSLLLKVTSDVKLGKGSGIYVAGIDGLNEFDKGPMSGWKYRVNGDEPDKGADEYILHDGDDVVWFYYGEEKGDTASPQPASKASSASGTDAVSTPSPSQGPEAGELKTYLDKSVAALSALSDMSNWLPFAYYLAEGGVPSKYKDKFESYIKDNGGSFDKVTDLERAILNAAALGCDTSDVAGYNLIRQLYQHDNIAMQGLNGVAFALLAFDFAGADIPQDAKNTKSSLIDGILSGQNADGGFSLVKGQDSDVDITAIALTALAPYKAQEKVKEAIDAGLKWLDEKRLGNNGFKSGDGVENSESLSWVIIARSALGLDIKAYVEQLKQYMLADGSFAHVKGGAADVMATEEGVIALGAAFRALNGQGGAFVKIPVIMPFSDYPDVSMWARPYIDKAKAYGIIQGDSNGRVNPQRRLSRAELVTMLVRALGQEADHNAQEAFVDVKKGDWYYGYVMKAYALGIAKGRENGMFDPEGTVTRQEAAVIVARLLGLKSDGAEAPQDISKASPWAAEGVRAAFGSGVMSGSGGLFEPLGTMTREMAIKIITTVYERKKAL